MSHNFKPGELALTLASKYQIPVMTTVSLVVFMASGEGAIEPDGSLWFAPHDGWVVGRDDWDGYGFFRPTELMPLHGDFTHEQQKAKEAA
ncbi:hypothetical protein FX985_03293 [Pseudomonas extremaustralis]|uniref:Uncharacterized protein n=1 Tax=Pseudomonas extremaustralis TaxID=359110 RepID=A0A5M9J6S6_9PSED|nr:hypothetical protein [Pseudomonas extremaustralis]KAA8563225.1 hypothetical protein FX985_03293 [Pseudomonas extremaustralis]